MISSRGNTIKPETGIGNASVTHQKIVVAITPNVLIAASFKPHTGGTKYAVISMAIPIRKQMRLFLVGIDLLAGAAAVLVDMGASLTSLDRHWNKQLFLENRSRTTPARGATLELHRQRRD